MQSKTIKYVTIYDLLFYHLFLIIFNSVFIQQVYIVVLFKYSMDIRQIWTPFNIMYNITTNDSLQKFHVIKPQTDEISISTKPELSE